jgi:hypothetical protein
LLIILIPALFAWILSTRIQKRNAIIYISTYLICGLLFFSLRYIFPGLIFRKRLLTNNKL